MRILKVFFSVHVFYSFFFGGSLVSRGKIFFVNLVSVKVNSLSFGYVYRINLSVKLLSILL
jgi:hypothetical protein